MKTNNTPSPIFDLDAEMAELYAERRRNEQQHRDRKQSRRQLTLRRGDICIARIAFTDGKGSKDRRVVIIALQGGDVLAVRITSRWPRHEFELPIFYQTHAGPCGPSTVQCSELMLVDRSLVFRVEGHVVGEDWSRILQTSEVWFRRVVMGGVPIFQFAV